QAVCAPGEIWISSNVLEHTEHKIPFAFESLGQHTLKNIAQPVGIFRVLTDAKPDSSHLSVRVSQSLPSVAVLPFTNMTGDKKHDIIGDAISENVINDLSRFHDLVVIARQSALAYKGTVARIQEVSRELGARYLVEGSVQKASGGLRVTAKLVDGP